MIGLREIRKEKHLNQQKVAMDLHITREALSHYENGRREPTLAMLVKMSEYFNVSIDYLITGKDFQKKCPGLQPRSLFALHRNESPAYGHAGEKASLPSPHTGHTQSSGMSSKGVPGAMPPSGSPTAGSYS